VSEESARRFARFVLEEHRESGTFEIEVADNELRFVKETLETLGCDVEVDTFRPRLTVTCAAEAEH